MRNGVSRAATAPLVMDPATTIVSITAAATSVRPWRIRGRLSRGLKGNCASRGIGARVSQGNCGMYAGEQVVSGNPRGHAHGPAEPVRSEWIGHTEVPFAVRGRG